MRKMSWFAFLSVSVLLGSSLFAEDNTPKVDFDRGVDSSAILRHAREEAAKWLSPIPRIVDTIRPVDFHPVNSKGVYPALTPLILNHAGYQNAANLRNDPRYRALPPRTLQPLEGEWTQINEIRRDLLSQASNWEGQNEQLYRDGLELDQDKAKLEQRKIDLNNEIDRYNQACTTRPLPPDEYRRCVNWRDSIIQRSEQLGRDIDNYNLRVKAWNDRSSAIHHERGVVVGKIDVWGSGHIKPWQDKATRAMEGGGCGKLIGVILNPAYPPPLSPRSRQPFEVILDFAEPVDNPCKVTLLWTAEGNIGNLSFPDPINERIAVLTTGNDAGQGSVSIEVDEITNNVKFKVTAQVIVTNNICKRNFIFPVEPLPGGERWRVRCNYICPPDFLCGIKTLFDHPPTESEIGFFCQPFLSESQVQCPPPI